MIRYFPPLKNMNAPNLVTSLSVIIGFSCFILAFKGNIKAALTLYAAAVLMDRLDGLIARKFKQESDFGKELDSLADSFNFCLMPAIFAYLSGFSSGLAVPALVLYILAGIWRLANYNLTGLETTLGKAYFTGVPTTVAASWFLILMSIVQVIPGLNSHYLLFPYFLGASLLMVSSMKYAKTGLLTKSLYVLIPMSLVLTWIRV